MICVDLMRRDVSSERRERIEAKKAALREQMELAELRQALSSPRPPSPDALGVQQAEISEIEKRTDVFVSTLRRFIRAMGGDPESMPSFPTAP